MRRAALAAAALCGACGEDPRVCPAEMRLTIEAPPGDVVMVDLDPGMTGVQTEVRAESTLARGDDVVLNVIVDGEILEEHTTTADPDGTALFTGVTIPIDGADLHVVGDAGPCGFTEDTTRVEVLAGAHCTLLWGETPEANPFYAPVGVLNAGADGAPLVPGYQGDVIVRAPVGHQVRLLQVRAPEPEEAIGGGTVPRGGELRLGVALADGSNSLVAECSVAGAFARRSEIVSAFVDTTPPACTITAPPPGADVTSADDAAPDPGLQVALAGHAAGADVTGEPAFFAVTAPGGATTVLPAAVDASGDARATATLTPETSPATYAVRFTAQDHARNPCTVNQTYTVVTAPP